MCAIFGIGFLDGNKAKKEVITELVKRIFIECQARGTHASGMALVNKSEIAVYKKNVRATDFVERQEYEDTLDAFLSGINNHNIDKPLVLLGHTRFETKGTRENNDNNHPIVANKVVGVHNGHIGNDDQLFNMFQLEHKSDVFPRKAKVDSEIIFRLVDHFSKVEKMNLCKSIKSAAEKLTGNYACGMVSARKPNLLWMFRNNNPMSIRLFNETGIIVFASMMSYITQSICGLNLEKGKEIKIDQDKCIGVNMLNNKISEFAINKT